MYIPTYIMVYVFTNFSPISAWKITNLLLLLLSLLLLLLLLLFWSESVQDPIDIGF